MRFRNHVPAVVIACLAVGISLTGVGYAASVLPRNSVGTAQLRNDAIVSGKIKDGSLLTRDVAAAALSTAPQGPKGEAGAAGRAGETGARGATGAPGQAGPPGTRGPQGRSGWEFRTAEFSVEWFKATTKAANCPAGTKAVGGGVTFEKEHQLGGIVRQSGPVGLGAGWRATVTTRFELARAFVWVLCTQVS